MAIPNWWRGRLAPDEIIGRHGMRRWWLLPENRRFNVYLHKHTGNDERLLHDHPCTNVSVLLRGELVEHVPAPFFGLSTSYPVHRVEGPDTLSPVVFFQNGRALTVGRKVRRFTFRTAEAAHRLELVDDEPAWTLWIRFRNRRRWGFFTPAGWMPWRQGAAWMRREDQVAAEATRP